VTHTTRAAVVLATTLITTCPAALQAAELTATAIAAFDRYVSLTERRMDAAGAPFLFLESRPAPQRDAAMRALRGGDLVIEPLVTRDGNKEIALDHAMVHHWVGIVFVRGATLDAALALLQDYDHHRVIYQPTIAASRLLSRDGDDFTMRLRFVMKKVVTVVLNTDHEAHFTRHGADRASSRIRSVRIAEVDHAGTAGERELPVGHDSGYLWRLNSYWRFLERDGGVYIQCESLTLTRDVPTGFGWLIRPFVTSIPRETLTFTLQTTRDTLSARQRTSRGPPDVENAGRLPDR
jgi:hypothetical protein